MLRTYYIATYNGYTGGVDVEGNRIVAAPPIWNHWKGRSFSSFCAYYKPVNMYEVPQVDIVHYGGTTAEKGANSGQETSQEESKETS